MYLLLHIQIPFAVNAEWERQQFADNIIYGIAYTGDLSPNYDSGMPFIIEWICRKFAQSICKPTAYANFDDTVGFTVSGTAVQQYKLLSLFIVYWVATHQKEFTADIADAVIWDKVVQILSENVDSFSVYTKLDEQVAWANEVTNQTLFSC